MASTLLSTLLNRMNRFQTIATVEEQYKVRDIDDAIRTIKRSHNLPFFQKKGSLKVFCGVYEYPTAADHDYLVFIDHAQTDLQYPQHLRARYTSFRQFKEDPDYRNQIAEIWNGNVLTLGVNDKDGTFQGLGYQTLDSAESTTDHTASGDASNLRVDNVNFIEGSASLAFTNTSSTTIATVSDTFTGFSDSDYLRKYYFRWVYLSSAPTSIELRLGVDSSNYLYKVVTSQFAGQSFIAGQWNLVAFDLNAASTTGTIDSSSVFAYEAIVLNGAATGTYNIDASYLRAWELMDYWYYSKYAVATAGNTIANQEYFYNSSEEYATDSALIGDSEWADVIMYSAMENTLLDKENATVLTGIQQKRLDAWSRLEAVWPDMKPYMTTTRYTFGTDDRIIGSDDSSWL